MRRWFELKARKRDKRKYENKGLMSVDDIVRIWKIIFRSLQANSIIKVTYRTQQSTTQQQTLSSRSPSPQSMVIITFSKSIQFESENVHMV